MAKNAADYRIKLHSGNNFDYAGWRCNALLHYGEHLPYVTDLYIGEGYNYQGDPGYWFVEMSGFHSASRMKCSAVTAIPGAAWCMAWIVAKALLPLPCGSCGIRSASSSRG
jgi:hypothetical protein